MKQSLELMALKYDIDLSFDKLRNRPFDRLREPLAELVEARYVIKKEVYNV